MAGNTYFFTHEQLTKLINGVQQPKDAILKALKPNVLPNPFDEEEAPTDATTRSRNRKPTAGRNQRFHIPNDEWTWQQGQLHQTSPTHLGYLYNSPGTGSCGDGISSPSPNIHGWDDDRMQDGVCDGTPTECSTSRICQMWHRTAGDGQPLEIPALLFVFSNPWRQRLQPKFSWTWTTRSPLNCPGSDRWSGTPQRQSTATSPKRRNHNKWNRNRPNHPSPDLLLPIPHTDSATTTCVGTATTEDTCRSNALRPQSRRNISPASSKWTARADQLWRKYLLHQPR